MSMFAKAAKWMRGALLALGLSVATAACAQATEVATATPPRLVVALSVDQFSADLMAQYRPHFTQGLKRLFEGVVFPSAYQAHAATETCPGHATLLTGVHPARSGIIANYWFQPGIARAEKRIYCSEDPANPASKPDSPVVSAQFLKVPTLGEYMKAANPGSRNVAVSGKDRGVVMMGGHAIDQAWWWKGGGFTTFAGRSGNPAVDQENIINAKAIAQGAPEFRLPAWCMARDRALSLGDFTIGRGRFAAAKGKVSDFARSPRLDAATIRLAMQLSDTMKLGEGPATDLLSISLSATDLIGHSFGTQGAEMCIQMAELDRAIGRLLAHLDSRKIDYVVMLTADHGGIDAPERLVDQALPGATRADPDLMPEALAKKVAAQTGITTNPLLYSDGPGGDLYVSAALSTQEKNRVIGSLLALLRAHPQIAAAYTAQEMADTPMPGGSPQDWTVKERMRASFDPQRSGDLLVALDRAINPVPKPMPGIVAMHGSPWDYDRRVPLLFWRKGMAGFEQPTPVMTVDIAPTLAALIGLKVPEGAFDGRCLDLNAGAGNTCVIP